MKKLKCGICGVMREEKACHIIVLTQAEKTSIQASGSTPLDQCVYCLPCWRTLSDPVTGPALMKGIMQVGLRHVGVFNSEEVSQKYHARLLGLLKSAKRLD